MGEGARADAVRVGDVAHREDAPVGQAAQPAIGRDAGRAGLHVAGREIERLEVRPPADRDQQMTAVYSPAVRQDQCRPRLDRGHRGALQQRHAARRQRFAQSGDQLRVVLSGDGRRLHHGDAAAQAGEGVGHLQPDGAAAEDQQVVGTLRQIEQRGVGQMRDAVQPGDRRHRGGAAGGDDDAAGGDPAAVDRQRIGRDEAGLGRAARWRRARETAPLNRSARSQR